MKKFIGLLLCIITSLLMNANNVVISNISLVGNAGNYRIQFDLSWDNNWRTSTGQANYDGVWVFFKYRTPGGSWQHLMMNGSSNSVPANYTAYQNTGVTKTGAIIHRTTNGFSSASLTDIELGVVDVQFGIDIRGYAIEMVFIPSCSNCIIGDGNGTAEASFALHVADNTSGAFGSTFSVDAGVDDATLVGGIAINAAGIAGNADYATGQAFWSMKYELSQAGYRDFLNSLNLTQQTTRTANAPTSATGTGALVATGTFRNFIEIATPSAGGAPAVYGLDASGNNVFDETGDGEWIACNYLSWMDIAAYLDWAGLAPMTEILYERICRGASTAGPNASVLGEYAWGTTAIFGTPYTITGANLASEVASNASTTLGNANYNSTHPATNGPLRNGIFATASSDRITSGASFYGVMEMSGNLLEPCVAIGNVAGRGFTSVNGDGVLSNNGNANAANWPCGASPTSLPVCSEVTSNQGTKLRGGFFNHTNIGIQVSQRNSNPVDISRPNDQGGRGGLYVN